ncbi:hypothetical protein L7F22_011451 [Adiantum nelumboides]|nr:hypothetical protein [Adiantum nelumboides]
MLNEENLPKLYWAEAVNTSVHLMNMSPTEALTRLTPKEAFSGIKPNVSTLKVFGCVAYMHIPDEKRRKLDVKSKRCVFIGYDMYSKGYRLVNPDTNKIHISRDVIFDESDRWFKNTSLSYEEVSMEGENTTSQLQNLLMELTISHESAQDIAQEDASLQSINSATCSDSHIHEEDSTLKLRRSTWLFAFTDADWGGSIEDRRSTSGYCCSLGSGMISWSSKKQPAVALFSTEAEYRGVANVTCEVIWLRSMLEDIGINISTPTEIFCGNLSSIYLANNPILHARTKHIEVHYHFTREKVLEGKVTLIHCSTDNQVADIFTKPVSITKFHMLKNKLLVGKCSPVQSST